MVLFVKFSVIYYNICSRVKCVNNINIDTFYILYYDYLHGFYILNLNNILFIH